MDRVDQADAAPTRETGPGVPGRDGAAARGGPEPVTRRNGPPTPRRQRRRRLGLAAVFAGVVLVLAVGGVWYWLATRGYESTDDAFIAADTVQVAPKVSGRVLRVPVNDNQEVKVGDLLVAIDPADFQARADQAKAALQLSEAQLRAAKVQVQLLEASTAAAVDQAKAELEAARAMVAQEQAALAAAKAEAQRAQSDWERYRTLDPRVVAASQRDTARAAAESATAQASAAERRVSWAQANAVAAQTKLQAAEANRAQVDAAKADVERRAAEVEQARAALRETELELSYTTVNAPTDGRVTRKTVSPGDLIQVGQTVMALVPREVYVTANFKETQLRRIRPGQPAQVHVDAYDADFPGHVDSIQAGAGAAFSLLPPENATGNYVKVVQRVPVKIVFDHLPDQERYHLGPGMSVVPRVDVRTDGS